MFWIGGALTDGIKNNEKVICLLGLCLLSLCFLVICFLMMRNDDVIFNNVEEIYFSRESGFLMKNLI